MTDQKESVPYTILITSAARRDLRKLHHPMLGRIDNCILGLATNPRPTGVKKLIAQDDLYRVRIGDFRVVYRINDVEHKVAIARVRHRKEVY